MNVPDLTAFTAYRGGPWPVTRFEYDGSNHVTHIGVAPRGSLTSASVWKIFRLTYSVDNVTLIESSLEDQVWDDRLTSVTYA